VIIQFVLVFIRQHTFTHILLSLLLFLLPPESLQEIILDCEVREKTNKMQQSDVYYQHFLNMFQASLCPSSGEQDVCYCMWCALLVLLDVVGSGCGALCCRVRAL